MRLIFLGTGHGVPTADRFCSATLIECNGCYYLIDAGAPVGQLFTRYGLAFENLKAVFLSHRHADHTFGLPMLLSLSNWYYKNSRYTVFMPEEMGLKALRGYMLAADDTFDEERMQLCHYEAGVVYADENITVTAIPTNHLNGVHPTYAFMVEGQGKRVFFTGDLHRGKPDDFPALAKELLSDAVITEFAHFGDQPLLPHLRALKTKQILFHHYNEKFIPLVENMQTGPNALDVPVRLLQDGDIIEL